jgi:dihydroxyacetone kinase-like protein
VKARDSIRSIGIALSPVTLPGASAPPFTLGPDEVEFGMGIHGEPGIRRASLQTADRTVEILLEEILKDMPLNSHDEVCTLINGLGSTTLMELLILNRKLREMLDEKGIRVHSMEAGSYCTTQEMAGMSISIMKLDEELKHYYDLPAWSPYYSRR